MSGLGRRSRPKPLFQALLQAEPVAVTTLRATSEDAAEVRSPAGIGGGGAQAVTAPPPLGAQLRRPPARACRGETVP